MDKNYKFPKVNFIGNKEKLCSWIVDNFPKNCNTIFDAFSGGCSVSYESKKRGLTVYSNDILKINSYLSKSIIQNSKTVLNNKDLENFSHKIESICKNLVNKGIMTKDLALMVGPDQKWLSTQELINSISNELNN